MVLVLGGLPLPGIKPAEIRGKPDTIQTDYTLSYTLSRRTTDELTKRHWAILVRGGTSTEPANKSWGEKKVLSVSVASPADLALPARDSSQVEFVPAAAPPWIAMLLMVLLIGISLVVAAELNLLRATPAKTSRFSLSKTILAAWTAVILYSYIALWLLTGEHNDILNETALILLGIAAFVAPISRRTDPKITKNAKTRKQIVSHGITNDITREPTYNENENPTLSRYQSIIWNLLLMIIYVWSVWRTLDLPIFDPTLLGVLGISQGLYLGMKVANMPGKG